MGSNSFDEIHDILGNLINYFEIQESIENSNSEDKTIENDIQTNILTSLNEIVKSSIEEINDIKYEFLEGLFQKVNINRDHPKNIKISFYIEFQVHHFITKTSKNSYNSKYN